jgi:L-alanine-DL-glutamate epimerase-like enolase superfamily enzyme
LGGAGSRHRSRKELGLPFITMRQLIGPARPDKEDEDEQARIARIRESFPDHVELVRDAWLAPKPRGWRWMRNTFARRLQSVQGLESRDRRTSYARRRDPRARAVQSV